MSPPAAPTAVTYLPPTSRVPLRPRRPETRTGHERHTYDNEPRVPAPRAGADEFVVLGLPDRGAVFEGVGAAAARTADVVPLNGTPGASPEQVRELLTAVTYVGRTVGPQLYAFFALLCFAGLRPSEALALKASDCELPAVVGRWGRLLVWSRHAHRRGGRGRTTRAHAVPCLEGARAA